jgi:hypothetical protein
MYGGRCYYFQFSRIFPYVRFDVDHGECFDFYRKLATAIQQLPEATDPDFMKAPGSE